VVADRPVSGILLGSAGRNESSEMSLERRLAALREVFPPGPVTTGADELE
jgi:hypothetical protein